MSEFDIAQLMAPISQDAPSGGPDPAGDPDFINLEIRIEGTPEREFDGKIVQEAKDPNWNDILEEAAGLLKRAHDLRVAMFLTRALLHTDGLNGLGTGLALLHGLINRYWESLYPKLDQDDGNDPIQRINILAALSEGNPILEPLKRINLCASRSLGQYSYRDILIASGKISATKSDAPTPGMLDVEAAFKDSETNDLIAKKASINTALNRLKELKSELKVKVGDSHSGYVPDFSSLSNVLSEMDTIMEKQLQDREELQANPDQSALDGRSDDTVSAATVPASMDKPVGAVTSRQDVIRLLDQICRYYQNNEPGSPVPLLLKRARQLVEKNFFEIINDLAPDSASQIQNLISGTDSKT